MLLIADSGSTKADWMLADKGKVTGEFSTMGFNPFFHDENVVLPALHACQPLMNIRDGVKQLKFYGAGCSSDDRNEIIASSLRKFFTNAEVLVDHDVLGSAIATCGDEKGIACIVGTGSNSCYYDGAKVYHNNYGLGYILGDEGSGSYFGKLLLTRYLYEQLPADLVADFDQEFGKMNKDFIINRVYHGEDSNVWLASFARFLTQRKEHAWVQSVAYKGMGEFLDLYVIHYADYKNLPVHFVGSVAFFLEDILRKAGADRDINIGRILKQPINGMMDYFIAKGLS
ncbi:hypothetical protein BH11BAC2_BH11BAC2_19250 [soil metagenome]